MTRRPGRPDAGLVLAVLVWVWFATVELVLHWPSTPLVFVWAAHGFVLMLGQRWIIGKAQAWPLPVRVASILAATVALALLQAQLDFWVNIQAAAALGQPLPGDRVVHVTPTGATTDITLNVNRGVYLWLFGFYAAGAQLLLTAQRLFHAALAAQRAEMEALRLQINPHFLFNALNSVSSLILTGQADRAEQMTLSLSRFYRDSLLTAGDDLVSLAEELETTEAYLDLERARLGSALAVSIDCPPELYEVRTPRLTLQPLIENALKHGVDPEGRPSQIDVRVERSPTGVRLSVRNAVAAGAGPERGTGVGLVNLRRRLDVLFGGLATLSAGPDGDGWRVVIDLPARTERQP